MIGQHNKRPKNIAITLLVCTTYLTIQKVHNKPQYVLCKTYHKKEDTTLTTISPPQSFPNKQQIAIHNNKTRGSPKYWF